MDAWATPVVGGRPSSSIVRSMFSRLFSKRQDPDRMAEEAIADYQRNHDELDVIARLKQAIALGLKQVPVDRAYLNLGAAYDDIDRLAEAEEAYVKALEHNPDNAAVLSNLGILYARRGEVAKAQSNYERAIALAPTDAKYKSNLAILYMDQGRYEEARQVLSLAVEQNSNASPFAFANLARCHAHLGDFAGAQTAFQGASRRGHKDVPGLQRELRSIQEELPVVHFEAGALRALALSLVPNEPECIQLLEEAMNEPLRVYRDLAAKGRAFFLTDYVVSKAFPWLLLCDELIRKDLAIPWADRSLGVWNEAFKRLWARSGRTVSVQSRDALRRVASEIEANLAAEEPSDEPPDSDEAPEDVDAFETFICEVSNQFDAVVLLLSESPERDLICLLPRVSWEQLAYPFVDAGEGYGALRVLSAPTEVQHQEPLH
jgi:tetratricopeptide (TPR) repeat protein